MRQLLNTLELLPLLLQPPHYFPLFPHELFCPRLGGLQGPVLRSPRQQRARYIPLRRRGHPVVLPRAPPPAPAPSPGAGARVRPAAGRALPGCPSRAPPPPPPPPPPPLGRQALQQPRARLLIQLRPVI